MVVPARVRSAYGDMDERRGWQWQPVIAGIDQGGDGEAAAGGLSGEDDVRGGDPTVQKGFIGRKSIVNRRRIRVLGGKPVVDGDDLGLRPPADLGGGRRPRSSPSTTGLGTSTRIRRRLVSCGL